MTFLDQASTGDIRELDTAIQDVADSTLLLQKAQKILENVKQMTNDERELRRVTRRRDITQDRQRGQEKRRAMRDREYTQYVPAQLPVRQPPALPAPPQGWYN